MGEITYGVGNSLPLQLLVFFHWRFLVFFFFSNLFLYTFKALRYYYPGNLLGWELTTVILYVFVNATRLLLISRGNKTSKVGSFVYSIIWAIPIITLHAYYIDLQTYV